MSLSFTASIAGRQLLVEVIDYEITPPFKGSPHQCDSDVDFYGEVEITDWTVTDEETGEEINTDTLTWPQESELLDRAMQKCIEHDPT